MPGRIDLLYLNDLTSLYDSFFLKWLNRTYNLTCITFDRYSNPLLEKIRIIRIRDLPLRLPHYDGFRVWALTLPRSYLVKRLLNGMEPDLTIGNNALSYGFYTALAKFKPFFLFVWGSDVLVWPKKSFFFKSVAEYSLKKADVILVDSDVQLRACIRLGASESKIIKAPWFDVNEIRSIKIDNERKREIRRNLGISEDEIVVISTRSHESVYSVETLILAASEILKNVHKIKFLIVGGGSRTRFLERLAQKQGVSSKILLIGKVSRGGVIEYLQASDIYVSTSLSDGTSASLLEAMACKVPPIVTDIPGNREWIADERSGLFFPVKDSQKLAEKIVRLLRDEDFRKSLGEKARERVSEKADWSRNSKLLDERISSSVNLK